MLTRGMVAQAMILIKRSLGYIMAIALVITLAVVHDAGASEAQPNSAAAFNWPAYFGEFQWVANTYRAREVKPELPEGARRFKVQAEGAVHDGDFAGAARYYAQAIRVAPWWPEGHFNAALVSAEAKHFANAMAFMKVYLMLAPDAPDARAAQDKIYDWERKADPKVVDAIYAASTALMPAETMAPGSRDKPRLGVGIMDVPQEAAAALGQSDLKGAIVISVIQGSLAQAAGITKADVIVAYNGDPISGAADLLEKIKATVQGRLVPIKIIRGSQELSLNLQF